MLIEILNKEYKTKQIQDFFCERKIEKGKNIEKEEKKHRSEQSISIFMFSLLNE